MLLTLHEARDLCASEGLFALLPDEGRLTFVRGDDAVYHDTIEIGEVRYVESDLLLRDIFELDPALAARIHARVQAMVNEIADDLMGR